MSRRWSDMTPVGTHYGIVSRLFVFIALLGAILVIAWAGSHQTIIR